LPGSFEKKLEDIEKQVSPPKTKSLITQLPTDHLEWIKIARPYVGKIKRTFEWEPFWIAVYKDKSPNIVVVNGRQSFKSTFGTDIIGCYATSHANSEVTYIVDREDRVSAWSKQRFRKDTMLRNELLSPFLMHGRANVGEINLTNNSVIYVRTDENEFNNVQGMTNSLMVFDECQYQELQFRAAALYSMTMTKGQCYYLGIGGEAGSEWYKLWKKSDQNEWKFDDKYWREKLKFDDEGYLANEHPENIVAGKWVAAYPENKEYRGYHMPQTIFARIPLTIHDAVNLYKTRPENSIEFQEKYNPSSIVQAHVYGNFFKAMRRPITPEMVEACYDYNLTLLTPKQIKELKQIHENEILIFLGIDWGSGPAASKTVGTVIIYWRKTNRYQIAWIDSRPQEHEYDQAAYFVKLYHEYCCDFCVADLGYGKDKVTLMQNGGYTSLGEKVVGLGRGRVKGCWTSGNITTETMRHKNQDIIDSPTVGEKKEHYSVDKTQVIQNFIDFVGSKVPDEKGKQVSQLIIPFKNDWECDFLVNDFCDITRKDLDKTNMEISKDDPRQKAKKEYNHPKDTVMAIIYCIIGKTKYDPEGFQISKIRANRRFRYN
jgi:hypothetical protein